MIGSLFFSLVVGQDQSWQASSHIHMVATGWEQEFDEPVEWKSNDGWFFCAMSSKYSDFYFDRKFEFYQCQWNEYPQARTEIQFGWCNLFDETMNCQCNDGMAVVGWNSEHNDFHEDRRWKPVCGKSDDVKIMPYNADDALALSPLAGADRNDHTIGCLGGRVACGMIGSHIGNNNGHVWEDRSYQLKCCEVKTRVQECATVEVTIEGWEVQQVEKPRNLQVDKLNLRGCGSDTEVEYSLSRDRSVEKEIEEQVTIGTTLEEAFSREVSAEIGITFSYSKEIDGKVASSSKGVEVSMGSSFSTSRSKTVGQSEEKMKRVRSMDVATFSSGYAFKASPGNVVEVDAMAMEYRGRIVWHGSAVCRSPQGLVLAENNDIHGVYDAVSVSEVTIVHETTICEVDGYDTQFNSYCKKSDWLLNAAGDAPLTGKTQADALDLCSMRNDCQCVMDRACNNAEDGFVLCKSGCSHRLAPSEYSCTMTKREECRCDHPNGGPTATGITCDDGFTSSCAAGKMCTTGSVPRSGYIGLDNRDRLPESPLCHDIFVNSDIEKGVAPEATCFAVGFHLNWKDNVSNTIGKVNGIFSPLECKKLCQRTDRCVMFSWRNLPNLWGPANTCYLKHSEGLVEVLEGSISGHAYCPGELHPDALISQRRLSDAGDIVRRLQG